MTKCALNVVDTIKVLDNLNFVTHLEKSVLIPTQVHFQAFSVTP